MPLLQFYHPPGLFSTADKQAISAGLVANVYTRLPAFYVNVHFIALDPENHYVAGVQRNDLVRIVIEHIAHHTLPKVHDPTALKDKIDAVIKPYVADKGMDWEFCVLFGQQHLWRINGYDPPIIGDDANLEAWRVAGKPMPRI